MEFFYPTVKEYVVAVGIDGSGSQDKPKRLARMEHTLAKIIENTALRHFHLKAEIFRTMIAERLARVRRISGFVRSSPVITYSSELVQLNTPCLPLKPSLLDESRRSVYPDFNLWTENFGIDSRGSTCDSCPGRNSCPIFAVRLINSKLLDMRNKNGSWDFPATDAIDDATEGLVAEAMGFDIEQEDPVQSNKGNQSGHYVYGSGEPIQHEVIQKLANVIGEEGFIAGVDTSYGISKPGIANHLKCSLTTVNQVISDRAKCLENQPGAFILKAEGCAGDTCQYFPDCPIKKLISSK